MRVRDLGGLVVAVGTDEQPVSGTKGAAMLALLTINVNQRVSVDALMDAAWGDQVTAGAGSTLESHMWRLRQLIEPDRQRGAAPSVLLNDAGGYRLIGSASSVDSLSFAEATSEVCDLLAAGHALAALRRADAALTLWRGRPYGVFCDAEWAQPAVARLEELRGQLQERRLEALLASGAADVALADVQPLIAQMPFRETLRGVQMQALYRGGRSDEALEAYRDARRTLLDEMGVEPGHELQDLHRRMLRHDPSLNRQTPSGVAARDVEVHLPAVLTPLVGREDAVARLAGLVEAHPLVTITGAAGCGKTRVAVDVARKVVDSFPDGIWFVDLTAVSDPELVVDVVVSTIGFAASGGASPVQDLRHYLQSRRILVVLDNCEHVLSGLDEIVRVVLGDPGVRLECCLLATSREPIGIDGETIWTLEPLGLPAGDGAPAASVELFMQRLTALAPAMVVDEHAMNRVVEICTAVDGLPLALELAAARTLSHSLDDIARQVSADPSRLSRLGRASQNDRRATVRSAIDWSHQLLTPREQRAHRRLSVLPGAFTSDAAAAAIGDGDPLDADGLLAMLVHRSMLASDGPAAPGRPTRFRQLATVRGHARHELEAAGETSACDDRRDGWTAALIAARPPLGVAAEAEWYAAIDDDYAAVRATLARRLIDDPSASGGRMAAQLFYYWYYRQGMIEASRWLQLAQGLPSADPTDRLVARIALAGALGVQGRLDSARPLLNEIALDGLIQTVREVPVGRLIEVGEALVGLATALWVRDAYDLLAEVHALLEWIVAEMPDANLALVADAVGCCSLFVSGNPEEALALTASVQQRAAAADNPGASWIATGPPMIAALMAGRPSDGIPWVNKCMSEHLRLGTGAAGMFMETRANYTAQSGDYAEAARLYAAARTETRRAAMVWPRRPLTHHLLDETRNNLSRGDFERAWQEGERVTMADLVRSSSAVAPTGVGLER